MSQDPQQPPKIYMLRYGASVMEMKYQACSESQSGRLLSTHTKSFRDNVLDPSRWFVPTHNLDLMWTDVCEDLAHLTCDVTVTILCTSEKGVTLTVILDVDLA